MKKLFSYIVVLSIAISFAEPIKSNIGAKTISTISQEKTQKVWTWKEYFFHLAKSTWPKRVIMPEEVNNIGRSYWLHTGQNGKMEDLCFLSPTMKFAGNSVGYSSHALSIVRMPYVTEIGYQNPSQNAAKWPFHLYIPKVKKFAQNNITFYGINGRLDVHIAESTCSEIMAFQNFPGMYSSLYSNVFFHGSDGTIYHDGTQWTITSDGAELQYPYEEDEIPIFTDDPSDEYWRDLFFKLTEDTWSNSVILPAEINHIGRQYWLTSSKIIELTWLCESLRITNDGYNILTGCSKLQTVRFPNLIIVNSTAIAYGNISFSSLHIPKAKGFGDARYTFGSNKTNLDVYIDESTCSEIMAFQNFPGCTGSMRSKVFFHGSDGTISFNGTEWVINTEGN